jgi:UDP-N-acetylmuramoyl-tripeptide--D-alanyl-D-alanine ligase
VLVTELTAGEIARRAHGRVVGDDDLSVDTWAFDSRAVGPGDCFVALRGDRDGHDFVGAAFDAGARVAVVDDGFDDSELVRPGRALVHVGDPLAALQETARTVRRGRPDLHVVAVGGSTGKTSTKDLLAAVLASQGCYANAESYNNEFGLPITVCNTPDAARVLVAEMGERFAGDLAALCEIARPDTGVVTNAGLAHAEHLGGPQGVIAVLSELVAALPDDGTAILNADDPASAQLASATGATVVTVGADVHAEYRIEDATVDARLRSSFGLRGTRFTVPLHGEHHVHNAAMAIAVAHHVFALPLDEIALALGSARPGRWRMELLDTRRGVTILNDSYNANPSSMEAALVALARFAVPAGGRRIAVLGDMRELGAHHDDAHREAGERAAALALDLVVGVGAGGAAIADAARAAGATVLVAPDAETAITLVAPVVHTGDAVLVKGSRAVGLERFAAALADDGSGAGDQGVGGRDPAAPGTGGRRA